MEYSDEGIVKCWIPLIPVYQYTFIPHYNNVIQLEFKLKVTNLNFIKSAILLLIQKKHKHVSDLLINKK